MTSLGLDENHEFTEFMEAVNFGACRELLWNFLHGLHFCVKIRKIWLLNIEARHLASYFCTEDYGLYSYYTVALLCV